jgi:uncharacterized membrane protein YbhN (UPF0104 family)
MKKWYNILFYVSILFIIPYLLLNDLLKIPSFNSYRDFVFSFFFLVAGFIFLIVSWYATLKTAGYEISFKNAYLSVGYSIYGKYIPGKIWFILGKAAYIDKIYKFGLKKLGSYSLYNEIFSIWIGLLIALSILLFYGLNFQYFKLLLILCLLLMAGFTKNFVALTQNLLNKILKQNIELPYLSLIRILKITPCFILDWFLRGVGLFFLVESILPGEAEFFMISFLPVAGIAGILSFIAPAGIGVREGVLTTLLANKGIPVTDAISVAVFSRLWFLGGESIIFLSALFVNKQNRGWYKKILSRGKAIDDDRTNLKKKIKA